MQQHNNIIQGSQEWLSLRKKFNTASEASAMLDISKYMSRNELLTQKKTGITPEVDEFTQKLFAKGHEIEALARPFAEKIIGEDLFNTTGSTEIKGIKLLASFDGITLLNDITWECKTLNNNLKESLSNGVIPDQYLPQLCQQLMVSGAEKALFMASDGTEDNSYYVWYEPNEQDQKTLLSGWAQFENDLSLFEPIEAEIVEEAKTIESLPSLLIQVEGDVKSSNLAIYKTNVLEFIEGINVDLKTDHDFAEAENVVKFCKKGEKEIDIAKSSALAQTQSIDQLFKDMDYLKEEMRKKRLYLDKLVKSKKETVKRDIIQDANAKFNDFISSINSEFTPVFLPQINADFATATKNKRTIASLHNSVDTLLSELKIQANEVASIIRVNLTFVREYASDYKFLFNDTQQIITKQADDFQALVKVRISDHREGVRLAEEARKKEEQLLLEAEKRRLKEENERKLEAEREKIRKEEKAKADKEAAETLQKEREAQAKVDAETAKQEPVVEQKSVEVVEQSTQKIEPNSDGIIYQQVSNQEKVASNLEQFIPPDTAFDFGGKYSFLASSVQLDGEFSENDLRQILLMMESKAA